MIQKNNNTSCLPFYTNINEQNHRRTYAYGNIYPLFTPANKVLPFQIIRPTSENPIFEVKIRNKDGTIYEYVTRQMRETGLEIRRFPELGYDVILYPGILPMALNQPEGIYYLQIDDAINTYYSEMYTVVNDMSCYLSVEWYDEENLEMCGGQIVYNKPTFRNILYFATELGKPDYVFEEEGEERDGYFFPEKQISEKTYKCTILAPEYLCDVMRFIRMADYVFVTDKYGRKYDCDAFLISPKWQTQGDLASVEIEFQTDTVVKKIGNSRKYFKQGDFKVDSFNEDFQIEIKNYALINENIFFYNKDKRAFTKRMFGKNENEILQIKIIGGAKIRYTINGYEENKLPEHLGQPNVFDTGWQTKSKIFKLKELSTEGNPKPNYFVVGFSSLDGEQIISWEDIINNIEINYL